MSRSIKKGPYVHPKLQKKAVFVMETAPSGSQKPFKSIHGCKKGQYLSFQIESAKTIYVFLHT